jgi:serine/threonine protein kinase
MALTDFGFTSSLFSPLVLCDQLHRVEWLSPEALRGGKDYFAQDIYSYGLLFFSVMTRDLLFPNVDNQMVLGYWIATRQLEPEIPSFIPPQLVIAFLIYIRLQSCPLVGTATLLLGL